MTETRFVGGLKFTFLESWEASNSVHGDFPSASTFHALPTHDHALVISHLTFGVRWMEKGHGTAEHGGQLTRNAFPGVGGCSDPAHRPAQCDLLTNALRSSTLYAGLLKCASAARGCVSVTKRGASKEDRDGDVYPPIRGRGPCVCAAVR